MTISERLATIAQNEQRVYEAGYNEGMSAGGGNNSKFTQIIDRTVNTIEAEDLEGITTIGAQSLSYCEKLSKVVIPDSVTNIGLWAFKYCTNLSSITLPSSVTDIGFEAFESCPKLVEIINKSNLSITAGSMEYGKIAQNAIEVHTGESRVVTKDDYLFYTDTKGNNYLCGYTGTDTNLILPDSYNGNNYQIFNNVFSGNQDIISITIPCCVTKIGQQAFSSCSNLTSVTFEENSQLTLIDDSAFSSCSGLTSIVIPSGVTSIGNYAFNWCDSLTNITIPNSVTSVGQSAFSMCSNLLYNEYDNALYLGNDTNPYLILVSAKGMGITDCTINSSTRFVLADAFSNCSYLTSITIPDSVTHIGVNAFSYCTSLTNIVIGEGIKSIGCGAFNIYYYFEEKQTITINAVTPPEIDYSAFCDIQRIEKIIVPKNSGEEYKTATNWSVYADYIEEVTE